MRQSPPCYTHPSRLHPQSRRPSTNASHQSAQKPRPSLAYRLHCSLSESPPHSPTAHHSFEPTIFRHLQAFFPTLPAQRPIPSPAPILGSSVR
ncbi:hypothetical protein BKA81DRAFT_370414, partial [Phyllosticta paracitricarpa]